MKTGYIQVYTGNGKGKSTAAFGLAMRAAGAGLRVFIAQFIKAGNYSEIRAMSQFKALVKVKQFGAGRFIRGKPSEHDVKAAQKGIDEVRRVLIQSEADVVIMDEINVAIAAGVVPLKDLLTLLELRPDGVELVLTGRRAAPALIRKADLVTEMKEIKHYYSKGIKARRGIEF